MDNCPFCRIATGERPAHVLYRDERTMAILDANPAREGHTLVIPTEHVEDLMRADPATTDAVFRTARAVAGALETALAPAGFSVFHTSGDLVGSVDHAHVHLLPRTPDDGVSLALDRDALDADAAAALVERVHDALAEH